MKLGRSTVAVVTLAVGLTTAAIVFHSQSTIAQTMASMPSQAATRPAAQISADAQELLSKVTTAYAQLKSFQASGTLAIEFDAGGEKKSEHTEITGSSLSPNQFRHELKGDDLINSDGKKLIAYVEAKNTYLQFDPPATRAEGLPMQIGEVMMDQDPSLLLALVPDAGKTLSSDALTVSKAADVTIDGKNFNVLNIVTSDQDTQVVIDPASNLLRRMTHDLSRSYKARGVPNVKTATVTVDYPRTAADPAANDPAFAKRFDWTAPADAKPMATASAADGVDNAPMQMEGKAAPAFTLKDLKGNTVSLADCKGKVVILDFWATFCMPCRAALPFVDKVAKDREKDAKVFAIDTGEDTATAQTGQREMNLSLPILVDEDGAVGTKYMADHGIPETVIIGKNGLIRKVMLGTNMNNPAEEETVLNSEIDAANKAN